MTRLLDSWIQSYLAYTAESESPEDYHIWVAISVIAGALRRQVFFDFGYFLLYPNHYIVLVSPPGKCKKSTAMRIGREFGEKVPDAEYSVDSTSRERLILNMAQSFKNEQSALTVHSSEFASLVATSGMDTIAFLTDVYDSPREWTHQTKGGGTNKIKMPCLNLMAGTTPDWIAKGLPLDTIGLGFTSRIVFIYQDTPRAKDPFPQLSNAQMQLKEILVKDLTQIATVSGQFKFDPPAMEEYREWYKSRFDSPNPSGDPRLAGYYERKPMHLVKLCMVVAASRRDETVMTSSDLQDAFALLELAEQRMPNVFRALGRNPLYADTFDIHNVLNSGDGFTLGDLLHRFGHNVRKEEMEEILETLMQSKKITVLPGGIYRAIQRVPDPSDGNGKQGAESDSKD